MFSWLNKLLGKSSRNSGANEPLADEIQKGNPAKGYRLKLSVCGPASQREEQIDLVEVLARVLTGAGRTHSTNGATLTDTESGVEFRPGIVSFQPKDDLSMQMCTTIEIRHPIAFPLPFFEYQHSVGDTGTSAVIKGFEEWVKLDLAVVLDCLNVQTKTCTGLEFSPAGGRPRRVLFGPISIWPSRPDEQLSGSIVDGQAHGINCPCCLFSQTMEAFESLVNSNSFTAIRIYAMRNTDGTAAADCRVNGEDHEPGREALLAYVGRWPGAGFEARKQYVIIQDAPNGVAHA